MDTQIGTRPQIGALEIHQAYILASLNWLQQTRSLEMNHVAIEKAKLLGFDHSSVITDAETYMNNLETFKCYNFFSQNFPGCIILKEEDFINLNVKYGLVSGPLSYYKGDIPEDNLDEILATKTTLDSLTDNKYSNRGVLSVEDLWDLSLEQLDPIAINLNKRLKESQTESFIKIRTKDTTELELKFNIVKHIIDVKLQERIVAAEKKAKRQKILDLMAKKQDAELESKSYEELAKELEALS